MKISLIFDYWYFYSQNTTQRLDWGKLGLASVYVSSNSSNTAPRVRMLQVRYSWGLDCTFHNNWCCKHCRGKYQSWPSIVCFSSCSDFWGLICHGLSPNKGSFSLRQLDKIEHLSHEALATKLTLWTWVSTLTCCCCGGGVCMTFLYLNFSRYGWRGLDCFCCCCLGAYETSYMILRGTSILNSKSVSASGFQTSWMIEENKNIRYVV